MWFTENKVHMLPKTWRKTNFEITFLLFVISVNSIISLELGRETLSDSNLDKSTSADIERNVASKVRSDKSTERSTWEYLGNIPTVPSSIAQEAHPAGSQGNEQNEVTDREKQNQITSVATTDHYLLNFPFERNKNKYTSTSVTASLILHGNSDKKALPLKKINKLDYNIKSSDSEGKEVKNWSNEALRLVQEDCGETNGNEWKNQGKKKYQDIIVENKPVSYFNLYPVNSISLSKYPEKDRRDTEENSMLEMKTGSSIVSLEKSVTTGSKSNVSNIAFTLNERYKEIFPMIELSRNITFVPHNSVTNMKKNEKRFRISHLTGSLDNGEGQSAWFGQDKDRRELIFGEPSHREKYLIPTLQIFDGFFPFKFMTGFFTMIYPFDFPTELVRDFVLQRISMPQLLIEVEASFIAVLSFFVCLALTIPSYLICRTLLRLMSIKEETQECLATDSCRRVLGSLIMLSFLVFFTSISACSMIMSNELASVAASSARATLLAAARDVDDFVARAHLQLQTAFVAPADVAVQAFQQDLSDIDLLLGEPVQKALASETGVDVALDALNDITIATDDISLLVSFVRNLSARGGDLAAQARDKLGDLRRQVDNFKRHCGLNDIKLCVTVDSNGVGINENFDTIFDETKFSSLKTLGQKNLTIVAAAARKNFNDVPKAVDGQTKNVREDIIRDLEHRLDQIHVSSRAWDSAARNSAAAAAALRRHFDSSSGVLHHYEKIRWMIMLGISVLLVLVICVLCVGLACACCGKPTRTTRTLHASVCLIFPMSMLLWTAVIVIFVIAGHAEVFLCRPLYDYPYYRALGYILDKPEYLYKDGLGFFANIYKDLPNMTIDVPVGDVLRECYQNKASYTVFRLDRLVDINKETSYLEWEDLTTDIRRLAIDPSDLKLHTPDIQNALQHMMAASNLNLSYYRTQLNGPITGKDLSALANQLENVANQITDLSTSSRIETLASRTRRVVTGTLQPLDQIRTELVYKLTELELQLQPYHRQMNQSLSHLKTIEYYIDNQGGVIAEQKIRDYVARLLGYLEQYRTFALNTSESWALCGPIWDVYDAGRTLLCRHYIDPLNGFWLCSVTSMILWIAMTPLVLNIARHYDKQDNVEGALLNDNTSHGPCAESQITSESSNWSIPRAPPPQDGAW